MKKILSGVLALFMCLGLSAQVKNYVGVVREKHYASFDEFLTELAASLKNSGYSSYSKYVDSYREGGFGSGFVYVDSDGTNYIVTNRHVVSQAETASIEFENEDGSTTKYENLSVYITDDDIDIAVLKFQGDAKPFKKSFSLYEGNLSDGQEVASAGFPGLGGDPVWQFGKGSVTNSSARIKELLDPAISTVIQHSAQIDGGNSGGPLLIASKNSLEGYAVAGVNTWKAYGRESTNFSIPAKLIKTLLINAKNPDSDANLLASRQKKFEDIFSDSTNDYISLVNFISYKFASEEGVDAFIEVMRRAPTKVANRVAGEFSYNPVEGLRYALAYKIYNNLSKDEETKEEKFKNIVWQKEHGLYRILSYSNKTESKHSDKKSNDTKSKKSGKKDSLDINVSFEGLERPFVIAMGAGGVFPLNDSLSTYEHKPSFTLGFNIIPNEIGLFGLGIEYEHKNFGPYSLNAFGGNVAFRLPFDFDFFNICPKASAGFKFSFDDPHMSAFFYDIGLETVFNPGIDHLRLCLEVGYRKSINSYDFFESGYTINDEENCFNFKLLVGYDFD